MEPRTKEPGSPVADVDGTAAQLEAKALVSPASEAAKRRLESPDKAPRNRPAAQKTTANPDDKKTFKLSPTKEPPSAGDKDGAAAATPAEPAAAAEEDEDEEVLEDAPPPLPPRPSASPMAVDDDDADDEVMRNLRSALDRTERAKAGGLKGRPAIRTFYNDVLGQEFGLEGFSHGGLTTSLGLRKPPSTGEHVDRIIDELKRRIRERPQKRAAEQAEAARAAAAVPAPAAPVDPTVRPMSVSAQAAEDALAALGGGDFSAITYAAAASRPELTERSLDGIVASWSSLSPSTRVRPPGLPTSALVPNLGDASPGASFARIVHAWCPLEDCYASLSCVCRAVRRHVAAADLALLARETPEGRVSSWMRVLDARHPWCRTLAKSARATPPLLGPSFDPNHDTVAATVAYFKAAAYDERLHKLREAVSYCESVEAGTEISTAKEAKGIRTLAVASPFSAQLSLYATCKAIRATPQQSAHLRHVLILAPHLTNFARDDRAEERLVENSERYLRERDAARQAARALLSRDGRLEALYQEANCMLRELDTLTYKRLKVLYSEARTLDVAFNNNMTPGTAREHTEAFLGILAGAIDESPAQDRLAAGAEVYENKWKPTENSDLIVAAHETTSSTYGHGDLFAVDPSLWDDPAVAESDAALREHYARPRGHWATHHGLLEPGLIVEDPPESLRDGVAFHADHYEQESAEDIVQDLHRAGIV